MIVFIDDDLSNKKLDLHVQLIRQKFPNEELLLFDNVDLAWNTIEILEETPKLCIVDMIMSTGNLLKDDPDARGMTRTGIPMARKIREKYPEVPIYFLTIVEDQDIKDEAEKDGNIQVLSKKSMPPIDLAEKINEVIKNKGASISKITTNKP